MLSTLSLCRTCSRHGIKRHGHRRAQSCFQVHANAAVLSPTLLPQDCPRSTSKLSTCVETRTHSHKVQSTHKYHRPNHSSTRPSSTTWTTYLTRQRSSANMCSKIFKQQYCDKCRKQPTSKLKPFVAQYIQYHATPFFIHQKYHERSLG